MLARYDLAQKFAQNLQKICKGGTKSLWHRDLWKATIRNCIASITSAANVCGGWNPCILLTCFCQLYSGFNERFFLYKTISKYKKCMDYDPSGPFYQSTMFDWKKHTQENSDVPHYAEILEFIDLRARASETFSANVQNATSSQYPVRTLRQ